MVSTDAEIFQPSYDSVNVEVGQTVTSPVSFTEEGLPVSAPAGATFALGAGAQPGASINPTTGLVTYTPPAGSAPGTVQVPVVVTYADTSVDNVTAPFVVSDATPTGTEADTYDPTYQSVTVEAGQTATSPVTFTEDGAPVPTPTGATFALGAGAPATASIDAASGLVTYTPPTGTAPGTVQAPVVVTYADNSVDNTTAPFVVTEPGAGPTDAETNTPAYGPGSGQAGTPITAPQTGDTTLPAGTSCVVGLPTGWTGDADSPNCDVTVTPPVGTPAGDYPLTVAVSYPDGSSEQVPVTITVLAPDADPTDAQENTPAYGPGSGQAGTPISVPQTGDASLPTGTECVASYPASWTVVFDANCNATVTPTAGTTPGEYPGTVTITYPDGSVDVVPIVVTVAEPDVVPDVADSYTPAYASGSTQPGVAVTLPQTGDAALPADAQCSVGYPASWNATFGDNCDLTVTPPAGTAPGEYPSFVTVTYSDGSTDVVPVVVTVTAAPTDAQDNTPGYGPGVGDAGTPIDVPQTGDASLPGGTECAHSFPAGWTVTFDDNCNMTVTPPADTPAGDYPGTVTITYPDDSVDTVPVAITVLAPDADPTDAQENTPAYGPGSGQAGTPISVPQTGDASLPTGTECSVGYADEWGATFDENCNLTVTAPVGTAPGEYPSTVTVTYPDGSSEQVPVTITVLAPDADPTDAQENDPGYGPGSGEAGSDITVPQTGADLPEGTTCTVTYPEGWNATFDENCNLTVTPPEGTTPGDYPGTVTVTYPDSSVDTVPVVVTVEGSGGGGECSPLGSLACLLPCATCGEGGTGSLGSLASGSLGGESGSLGGENGSVGSLLQAALGSLGVTAGSLGDDSGTPGTGSGSTGPGSTGDGSGSIPSSSLGSIEDTLGSGDGGGTGSDPDTTFGSLAQLLGSVGGTSSLAPLLGSTGGAGSLAVGSIGLGALAIGGVIHGINTGMISLPPGFQLPAVQLPPLPPPPPGIPVGSLGSIGGAGQDDSQRELPQAPGPSIPNGRG
ncbi:hypothetical protein NCCP2495_15030 [Dietzia sp. NCCP-2495]|uniref:Rib/alpha-like domain-containing protein n=1 Tax=Dietzia sp. NCCP-2495 TaxID=2934675 RepID=UPI00280EF8A6|nr:Rib/alpha-like domain-containing protein [Dietzia sp. NCCP-2495]GLB63624.1 hypothetical protein NCCP2495_15030 [Dietzia sp. NCCP-2495]